jgi:hypothetical protein
VSEGSIGTIVGTVLDNTGNAPASVALQGSTMLSLPSVFGLQNNPTTLPPNTVTGLTGTFTPNALNASWSGEGELVITASSFCAPLPMAWAMPMIALSGASTSNPALALTGNLVFPSSNCGGPPPGGQSVTLSNLTNQPLSYTAKLSSGVHYTLTDGGSGMVAANGTSTLVVNPVAVTPGAGVVPGSAPYADNLVVTVATMPATILNEPISWTLTGAVLSLPDGAGPFGTPGNQFYVADTMSGFPLRISNTGTATATVELTVAPPGAFALQPAAVNVIPGIPALPALVAQAAMLQVCPTTNTGTATFMYSGPVCQPLPLSSVSVQYCAGAYTGGP